MKRPSSSSYVKDAEKVLGQLTGRGGACVFTHILVCSHCGVGEAAFMWGREVEKEGVRLVVEYRQL